MPKKKKKQTKTVTVTVRHFVRQSAFRLLEFTSKPTIRFNGELSTLWFCLVQNLYKLIEGKS